MHALKCPKCGREVIPQRGNNGFLAECCDWIYFRPAKMIEDTAQEDDIEETEQ